MKWNYLHKLRKCNPILTDKAEIDKKCEILGISVSSFWRILSWFYIRSLGINKPGNWKGELNHCRRRFKRNMKILDSHIDYINWRTEANTRSLTFTLSYYIITSSDSVLTIKLDRER